MCEELRTEFLRNVALVSHGGAGKHPLLSNALHTGRRVYLGWEALTMEPLAGTMTLGRFADRSH